MPKMNDLFCISEGIYSDYRLFGHFKALKDFSIEEESRKYIDLDHGTRTVQRGWLFPEGVKTPNMVEELIKPSTDGFQAYLIRQGLCEDTDVKEYWAGDYQFDVIKDIS